MTTPVNPFNLSPVPGAPVAGAAAPVPPPIDPVASFGEPVAPPAPVIPPALVSLTREELSALLADAVKAGQAQAQAANALGAPAIVAEIPEDWSLNWLFKKWAGKTVWHTEREERAAYAAIDKYMPEPVDELAGV